MTLAANQLSIIHIAKQQLRLDDDVYRDILRRVAGVASSKDLDNFGFDAVMETFARLGFVSTSPRKPFGWHRPGMASNDQVRLIRLLWDEWTNGEGTADGLNAWLKRTFKVEVLRFLTAADASKAITGLKKMKQRKTAKQAA